ncbi:MAG TPA: hypothetical protein VJY35_02255 [Candidatus Eisenbacteria bacterium]|nr:hypothetical protein [Candidatus Eisenbacteria bacterium]
MNAGTIPARQILRCVRQDYSEQPYFLYLPEVPAPGSPLLVAVHGLERNPHALAAHLADACEVRGVTLVAPLFGAAFADYQRLGRAGHGPRADLALEAILDQVAEQTRIPTGAIHLFGHGAGAQFAHRYVMAYPHRVAAAVVVAAGWYTLPNPRRPFPYGIRRIRSLPDLRPDADEFLRVPMTAIAGTVDAGLGSPRQTQRALRQGRTRAQRAEHWAEAMRAAAERRALPPLTTVETVDAVDNGLSSLFGEGRLAERVFAALFGGHPARTRDGVHG